MSIRDTRREAAIDRMAEHLLRVGMAGASLRPLAAAAGTSDRMLLYYFADRDDVLTATLQRVAIRLAALLDATLPPEPPRPFAVLLDEIWTALTSPALLPYTTLWLELAGAAGRGQQPQRDVAGRIADGFLGWIARRLDAPDAERPRRAALLLAAIEGMLLLDAVGRRPIAGDAAAGFEQGGDRGPAASAQQGGLQPTNASPAC